MPAVAVHREDVVWKQPVMSAREDRLRCVEVVAAAARARTASGARGRPSGWLLVGVLLLGGCYLSYANYLDPGADARADGSSDTGADADATDGADDGNGGDADAGDADAAEGGDADAGDDGGGADDAGPPRTCSGIVADLVVPDDFVTIQAAIDAAADGQVICVQPSVHQGRIDFLGKRIRVVGVAGPEATILEPDDVGSVVTFAGRETAETVFEGFTVRGGTAMDDVSTPVTETDGGGILVRESSPTLRDLIVRDNAAEDSGGGMKLDHSAAELIRVAIFGNEAGDEGGGLALFGSSPTLTDVLVAGNRAHAGGGLAASDSHSAGAELTLLRVRLMDNEADYEAGAMTANRTTCRLTNVVVANNRAGNGTGGLLLAGAPGVLDHVRIVGNVGGEAGITLVNDADGSRLTNVVIAGNRIAGGLWVGGSEVSLENVTIVGNVNEGDPGGGIGVDALGFLTMTNVAMAGNRGVGGRAICSASPRDPAISYSAFWNHGTWPFEGLGNPIGVDGNFTADPLFIDSSAEDPVDWDLHLAPDSPLLHTGNPALADPDGSRSSIGAYGGPGGDAWDLEVAPPGIPSVP